MNKFVGTLTEKGIVTKEYHWFKNDDTNRRLDSEALEELEESMNPNANEEEYPFQAPIVVYWDGEMSQGVIQQGHHRFHVCKAMNREVNYVITSEYMPPSRNQEYEHQDWETEELVESYAKEDIPSYRVLWEAKRAYPKYSFLALSVFFNKKVTSRDYIRRRKFKVDGNVDEALQVALYRIRKYEEFLNACQRNDKSKELIKAFISAYERPDFDWNYFIERCKANSSDIIDRQDYKSVNSNTKATALIMYLYNYNSKKKNIIL